MWLIIGFIGLSNVEQISPGHYIISRSFKPIQDAVYWDADYPDKMSEDVYLLSYDVYLRPLSSHFRESLRLDRKRR